MPNKTLFTILYVSLLSLAFQTSNAQWGGFGGRGGRGNQTTPLVAANDKDGNGWLDKQERDSVRRPSDNQTSVTYNPMLKPEDVKWYTADEPLYDIQTLRTIFLEFENQDWEAELEYFFHTDVEVPAKMIVDGKTYENVGVRFRGNSSYSSADTGWKRPLNISMDFIENKQYLFGYRTLNLMNSHNDASFLRQVLYNQIAEST